jgi:hypothetical protein
MAAKASPRLFTPCGEVLATLVLRRDNVQLRSRRLCDTHGGRSRGMPHRLLSLLPFQRNGVGNPPPLVRQGDRARRTVSSLRHGQRSGEMELSMKQRSMESTKTNTVPLPSAPDVTGAFADTGGNTP